MTSNMPKEHPRARYVRLAQCEIGAALANAVRRHGAELTSLETIRVVTAVCHDYVAGLTKYMLRIERHGDNDKPADWE